MALAIMRRLPFARTTTPLQAATYLLGISLFSISFLVFLNSSISFVITDRIGVKRGVGDIVGTLGFVDELVALVACPVWGLVSDRLGVRLVAVLGYVIIAASLVLFVLASNIYPQLLLARVLFATGATAAATMVTAILPSLTADDASRGDAADEDDLSSSTATRGRSESNNTSRNNRYSIMSAESQLTITPERFAESSRLSHPQKAAGSAPPDNHSAAAAAAAKPSQLAGFVGVFTGCGALLALSLFLPLPAQFARADGVTMAEAVARSFYVVAAVALLVAVFVLVGLRGLHGEDGKGWRMLLGRPGPTTVFLEDADGSSSSSSLGATHPPSSLPYYRLLRDSVVLGFTDADIALGYLGGFVARASTVAISLFMPLFINAFFIRNGFCQGSPHDSSPELKKECRAAYVLASILTGVAQLMGLLCAPLFGYLSSRRYSSAAKGLNIPIIVATTMGIAGYLAFPLLSSPEPANVDGRGGSGAVFAVATLIGISQIGAIVCSLGSLGQGIISANESQPAGEGEGEEGEAAEHASEHTSLLGRHAGGGAKLGSSRASVATLRIRLKGSIAGVYSWCGGAAILLLTKLGGYLFDAWSTGAPFYMMALFNGMLLAASLAIDARRTYRQVAR